MKKENLPDPQYCISIGIEGDELIKIQELQKKVSEITHVPPPSSLPFIALVPPFKYSDGNEVHEKVMRMSLRMRETEVVSDEKLRIHEEYIGLLLFEKKHSFIKTALAENVNQRFPCEKMDFGKNDPHILIGKKRSPNEDDILHELIDLKFPKIKFILKKIELRFKTTSSKWKLLEGSHPLTPIYQTIPQRASGL